MNTFKYELEKQKLIINEEILSISNRATKETKGKVNFPEILEKKKTKLKLLYYDTLILLAYFELRVKILKNFDLN